MVDYECDSILVIEYRSFFSGVDLHRSTNFQILITFVSRHDGHAAIETIFRWRRYWSVRRITIVPNLFVVEKQHDARLWNEFSS